MPKIEIFTKTTCGFCRRAKMTLEERDADFEEFPIDRDPELRGHMIERAGGRTTVPQIFIDGYHVGGYDELSALDDSGRLDQLLEKG
jgi:glutaredoxin 3